MQAALCAQALGVSLGACRILQAVDMRVDAGTILGVVGPNGAGKTTLLRALAGVVPHTGALFYGAAAVASLSARERARRRAYVGQLAQARLPYTVQEVVAMGLSHTDWLYRAPHAPGRVADALAEVACAVPPTRRFDALSGGERQQVLVARVLIQNAPLLLLDEPLSALDLRHQAAVVRALRRRAAGGGTVLLSLHDLSLAALLCHVLCIVCDGRVRAIGPTSELLDADLLGEVYGVPLLVGQGPVRSVTLKLDGGVL